MQKTNITNIVSENEVQKYYHYVQLSFTFINRIVTDKALFNL